MRVFLSWVENKTNKVRGSLCSLCGIYKICKGQSWATFPADTFLGRRKYVLGM